MPSGLNDTIAAAVLDQLLGSGADTSLLGATMYLDLFTTGPIDDNGTGAVPWGQGRVAVSTTDAAIWVGAADRQTVSTAITSATNTSGDTLTVVAFGWYSASTSGTYMGGAPLAGGSVDVLDGTGIPVIVTLASASPSE